MISPPSSLQVALTNVIALLSKDLGVHNILQTAAHHDSLSIPKFDHHMRCVVWRLGQGLAHDPQQDPDAAWFIQRYSNVISTALILGALQEAGSIMSLRKAWSIDDEEGNGSSSLESFLDFEDICDGPDSVVSAQELYDGGDNSTTPRHPGNKIADFADEELKDSILGSMAFHTFRTRIQNFVHPPFLEIATRLVASTLAKYSGPSGDLQKLQTSLTCLIVELNHSTPANLDLDFKTDVSKADSLKVTVEAITRKHWNWWPLSQPQHRLDAGQVRLVWTCVSIDGSLQILPVSDNNSLVDQSVVRMCLKILAANSPN